VTLPLMLPAVAPMVAALDIIPPRYFSVTPAAVVESGTLVAESVVWLDASVSLSVTGVLYVPTIVLPLASSA
jgi:hypothetical protein